MESIFSGLISFGYFLIVLGLAVIFHEWGHFIVAKLCGARVERFAVGFGKTLLSYKPKNDDTEYVVCALPLGGYVKITGMDPDDEITGADYEYLQLAPWKRIAIVLAGPLMNFVLAYLIYIFLMAYFGSAFTATTTVGYVPKGSWGWEMGLRDGDRIVSVNSQPASSWNDVVALQSDRESNTLQLTIERGGEQIVKSKQIPTGFWAETENEAEPPAITEGVAVLRVLEGNPAAEAGLEPGMVVTAVDGQTFGAINEWTEYFNSRYEITDNGVEPVPMTLTVKTPDGETRELEVTPKVIVPSEDASPSDPITRLGAVFHGEVAIEDYLIPTSGLIGVAPKLDPVVGGLQEGGPADQAGIDPGSRIVEINGEEIDDWNDLIMTVQSSIETDEDGKATAGALDVTWMNDDGVMQTKSITPSVVSTPIYTKSSIKTGKEYHVAQIGVDRRHDRQYYGVIGALSEAWNRLVDVSMLIFNFIFQLFTGEVSPRLLGGPIAIFQMSGESGRWGMERFLGFIAMLSANLGVINLFPLPPFDGGHLVFYFYEIVRRKPITMKQMENFGKIGFIVVLPLLFFLVFNDLSRVDFFDWIAGLLGLS